MNEHESFSDSIYEQQMYLAETELCSFTAAVAKLYGSEQAKISTEDWLEESELIDGPPRSEARNWHAVTIAASARLEGLHLYSVCVSDLPEGSKCGTGFCLEPED